MTTSYTSLSITLDGHIARLNLERPDQNNSFDAVQHREFSEALGDLKAMADIRVILLTAQGKTFSAGGDFGFIRRLNSDDALRESSLKEGFAIFDLLTSMHVPVVVAVHGHAMGLGATIISLCDISVAWKDAKIADPHVLIGLVAGDGGVPGWTAAIGLNRARRYLLTGETITGAKACELGLVTDVADTPDDARAQAEALAQKIAALPPMAVQGTRKAFNEIARTMFGQTLAVSFAEEMKAMTSEDILEAINAAQEKRPARYNNR